MTLAEFKAWFDGFTESMDSTPNAKQWERIKARVAEIDDKPTSYPVFVDRYIERYPYRQYWSYSSQPGVFQNMGVGVSNKTIVQNSNVAECKAAFSAALNASNFNSHSAMMDLGKAEYREVA